MTDLRARLADALMDGVGADELDAYQAADVLLSLPGIAIVELPELPGHLDPMNPNNRDFDPAKARELAAALLAAADKAEKED
jgi:hypothetical protein